MGELRDIGGFIKQRADENANIIQGLVQKDDMEGKVEVVVIGTGLRKIDDEIQGFIAANKNTEAGDLNKPTFMRFKDTEKGLNIKKSQDISIPAYLRRQAD